MSDIFQITHKRLLSFSNLHPIYQAILLLSVHGLVWTTAAWLLSSNLDMQGDMLENYVWGIEWQAGYFKHPPLFAWIVAAWFWIVPQTDVAYFSLSALNAAIGLFGIMAIASRFMPLRLALVAALAMAVSPLYSNLAIKFNANAVLLSVWPWTAYCFVRFMQTGRAQSAIALGVLAGAAVLAKYFSVVLLMSLLVAALVRPAWRARLGSWRILLSLLTFSLVLAPHLHWLAHHQFATLDYAQRRTGGGLVDALWRFPIYATAQLGYLLLSFGFVVMLTNAKRGRAAYLMARSYMAPSVCPDLWWLSLAPLMVVGGIAVTAKIEMASVWGMAQWFAIVPLWLIVLHRAGITVASARAARVMVVYWLIVIGIMASLGYIAGLQNTDDAAEPRAELAQAAHAHWCAQTGTALGIVAGSMDEARSVAFYGKGRTRYWDLMDPNTTPWLSKADVKRSGAMLVCRRDDAACLTASTALCDSEPIAIEVSKKAWGIAQPSRVYWLFAMLPQSSVESIESI